ncbi:MAG TPA: hypothetical protein VJB89_02765 [Candidatus Nanoarchaeia archaeon]|nr:hypothetical protein [Candidatus Nanoarchaeia archaeon]
MDVVITYESLYEMLRLEKFRKELQKIDQNYYENVTNYLKEKRDILKSQESKDSVFASKSISKTRKQIENVQKILKELYERRESKIIQMALFSSRMNSDVGNRGIFLKQEEFFFDQLVQIFNQYRMDVLDSLIRGNFLLSEPKSIKKEEDVQKDIQKVKFLDVVPKFIGEDLNIYGPYEMEQEVDLPIKMVDLLVKIGKVKKI